MRHPFWKWTQWASLVCVGLSGCLHGQDWRAAVSKPLARPVADRRESLPQPKVIGPLRKEKTTFVPPSNSPAPAAVVSPPARTSVPRVSGRRPLSSKVSAPPVSHVTPLAIVARPPALTASGMVGPSRSAAEAIQPPTTKDEAQPRGAKVLEAGFIPPPAPPATPQMTARETGERGGVSPPVLSGTALATGISPEIVDLKLPVASANPLNVSTGGLTPPRSPQHLMVQSPTREVFAEFERTIPRRKASVPQESAPPSEDDEIVVAPKRERTTPRPLPLIIPAGTSAPVIQPGVPRSLPLVSAKELPDVTDTINTAPDLPHADLEQIARPRDVAVLVEQVFEDLRQRRLDQARQRTAWLKQIVTRRELAVEESSAAKQAGVATEPLRLQVDEHAAPVNATPSEKLLDDDAFKNRP